MNLDEILQLSPFSLNVEEKEEFLRCRLLELTEHHRRNCREYDRILKALGYQKESVQSYKDLPFLPVRLFKELNLKSVTDDEVFKIITSSGTTSQKVSRIILDRSTAQLQQQVMTRIVGSFLGHSRVPMIIIDSPSVIKDRTMFSVRGAGILGFSIFGTKKIYALNDEMKIDLEALAAFVEEHKGETILLFGFTFMIWQHFYKELLAAKERGFNLDLSEGIMIHGGGWKKLQSEAVSPHEFNLRLEDVCCIRHVHEYYGMVEQTGCIYMQCECGHLHASNFSDVIIRDPFDFSEKQTGQAGLIEVVSSLPWSYPGHVLLTEDEGMVLGEDDCPCGRKGRYFKILGRIANAELRGCSDTYAAKF